MGVYEKFASVYDLCMSGVPYDKWVKQIEKIWKTYDFKPVTVLELGCGTGNMAYRFAGRAYDMTAVDFSEHMLSVAAEKNPSLHEKILFIRQDIRDLDLYGTVDAMFSVFDCMNYMTREEDLTKIFLSARNYLNPGGIFIFDMNAEKKYARISDEGPMSGVFEDVSFIWENSYDKKGKINECAAHFFIREDADIYKKYTEYHYQKAYEIKKIAGLIVESGLTVINILDAATMKKYTSDSERVYIVVKK